MYDGDLKDESEVLEWLIQHQTSIDEEDTVENASKVTSKSNEINQIQIC